MVNYSPNITLHLMTNANTLMRNPEWNRGKRACTVAVNRADADRLGWCDGQQVRVGRWCSVVLAVAAMAIAPTIDTEGSLYEYLQQINATFFGPSAAR